jgi:hypothetical protein
MTDAGLVVVGTDSAVAIAAVAGPDGIVTLMVFGRPTSTVISWVGAVTECRS